MKDGGLDIKSLRLQCNSEEASTRPQGAGINIAYLRGSILGGNGPVLVLPLC